MKSFPKTKVGKLPQQILDEHIGRFMRNGLYVDSSILWTDLNGIFPKLSSNETFRAIQSVNKFVDSAIDAYWHTHSIRLFTEIEKFVVQTYNRWRKKEYSEFIDIGVGCLSAHPKPIFTFFCPFTLLIRQ